MLAVDEVTAALREIEPLLGQTTHSAAESVAVMHAIEPVRELIAQHGDHWIGLRQAKNLLATQRTCALMYLLRPDSYPMPDSLSRRFRE